MVMEQKKRQLLSAKEKVKKSNKLITDEMINSLQKQIEEAHIIMLKAQGALEVLLQLKDKE